MNEAKSLKKQIYEDMRIEEILQNLGMHHIKVHNNNEYWTCGMPNGDNISSTVVYNDEKIGITAYTRTDENITDIISLIQYVKSTDFRGALSWIYETLHIQKKHYSSIDKCKIINPTKTFMLRLEKIEEETEEKNNITLYDDEVLNKYISWDYENKDFEKDNILPYVQNRFRLIPYLENLDVAWNRHYYTGYMVIPILDELGNVVGTKLRIEKTFQYSNNKYFSREQYSKTHFLYGLYQTKYHIDKKKEVIICEAEKGVMQLYSYGYKNAVAIGGHDISKIQVEKIIKLNVNKVIIAFDEDVSEKVLYTQYQKLCDFANVTCIIDKKHLLNEKESPMDNPKKWENLYKNYKSIPREYAEMEV